MSKRLLGALAAAVVVLGVGILLLLGREQEQAPPEDVAASEPVRTSEAALPPAERQLVTGPVGLPTRLEIVDLDIDAPVEPVGTTPENAQEVPAALDETGWWRDGAVPGAPGNAVIVGHTASADDGVFDPLVDVEAGDEVLVTGSEGTVAFTVERSETVAVEDFADVAADVYRADGASGLVLMTCGDWNGTAFESTVIVHAVPSAA
ncbi:class F sortase [Nocardioides zeae]|uniref:Class F sortase n=1 Tax=Nocardioides imazamoxiresistens TaxID=3231893 RepID=A0ABU3PRU8_9ACTN|nr:class F sortase [Nocardioides zeae]MDT9591929.1 class F sortase [Nocardioides zeae]